MVNLDLKLENLYKLVTDIYTEINLVLKNGMSIEIGSDSKLQSILRSLNFEANEFFENLNKDFDINNKILLEIINTVSSIVESVNKVEDENLREIFLNLLNFEYFLIIHLLFVLSDQNISLQSKSIVFFNQLLENVVLLDLVPTIEVNSLDDKKELEDYIRLLGSAGDMFYLACVNLQKVDQRFFIDWTSNCFQQFQLLDNVISLYNPLEYYHKTNQTVADLYRDIVGYYTIIGNTNATNLLELVLSMENSNLGKNISYGSYISSISVSGLIEKLNSKRENLTKIVEETRHYQANNIFFTPNDKPLENISFKLIISLEKYFSFSIAKLRAFKKEWNQIHLPTSEELKIALNEGQQWIDYVLDLTEKEENILDTPFGGLFNYIFLEYLLLIALDCGKNQDFKYLEKVLDNYGPLYNNKDPNFAIEFKYIKIYAQIYVYTMLEIKKTLSDLSKELSSLLQYLNNRPYLEINSRILILIIEKLINYKSNKDLRKNFSELREICENVGIDHIKSDLLTYMSYIENIEGGDEVILTKMSTKEQISTLDIHSWLVPPFNNFKTGFKFINFNQTRNKLY